MAKRKAIAESAFRRKLIGMTPEERAEAIAAEKKTQEELRAKAEAAKIEEARLKEALSQVGKSAKSEDIKQTGEKLGKALEALQQGEDEAYLVYLKTKLHEAERKVQQGLKAGMIDEKDSEALADWKEKVAQQEAKIKEAQPYEEITIEPWKKKG